MASTNNKNAVKFMYFQDTVSPRTVTVARLLEGDKMYIAWACNRMVRNPIAFATREYKPTWHGDRFVKNLARTITTGRVELRADFITIDETQRKTTQVVQYMLATTPKFVRDIVQRSVDARQSTISI